MTAGGKKESAMYRLLLAAALATLAPAAYAADAQQMEANKKAVLEFYDLAINKKDFEAASKFIGSRYVQHNPRAADGPEGLKAGPDEICSSGCRHSASTKNEELKWT